MTEEFEGRPDLIKARARDILLRNLMVASGALFVLLVLIGLTYNAFVGADARAQLIDCTTPGSSCYDEGQKRMEAAVENLIQANQLDEVATRRIVVLAAACAERRGVNSVEEIQVCVDKGLKEDKSNGD